jgi:glycosyltransferase involved in cell wall biosynthesis
MVKVSVVMITYNQEAFIEEAILGVLAQKTNFEIELIVSDDCSTDRTELIVKEVIRTNPNGKILKYTRHHSKKGMMANFIWALQHSKGKYIALCEGDDFWTDPTKLRNQVDFLEANPDFVICFSLADELYPDGVIRPNSLICRPTKDESELIDLIENGNYIHTPSVMFVNCLYEIPSFFNELSLGDYPLYLILAEKGRIKFLSEVTAVYRRGVGVWSTLPSHRQLQGWVEMLSSMITYFEHNKNIKNLLIQKFEKNCKLLVKNLILTNGSFQVIIYFIFFSYKYKKFRNYYFSKELIFRFLRNSNYRLTGLQLVKAFSYQFYPSFFYNRTFGLNEKDA